MRPEYIFIAVAIAFVLLCLVVAWLRARQRRDAMRRAAGELGFTYQERDDELALRLSEKHKLFAKGRKRRALNVLSGVIEDLQLHLFDYLYVVGGGKNSHTYRQTVAAFRFPEPRLPSFTLTPEGIFSKIAQAFGSADIDFDDHPEFSKRYVLKGPDEEAIRNLFTGEVIGSIDLQKRMSIASGEDWLIIYRNNKRVKPEELSAFIDEAFTICNVLG